MVCVLRVIKANARAEVVSPLPGIQGAAPAPVAARSMHQQVLRFRLNLQNVV